MKRGEAMNEHIQEQLRTYLSDVYSIEQQALAQLRKAHEIAGESTLARHLEDHLHETERQAELVEERLEAAGGSPSQLKDAIMRLGGKGFLLFARVQPDTPGKLAAHAHSYEALELAAYEMLIRMARLAGDDETARVAHNIRDQEQSMRDRIAATFADAADASLRMIGRDARAALPTYLADAHALEMRSIELLKRSREMAGSTRLAQLYDDHLDESLDHARLLEERLEALDADTSTLKDTALKAGALNWSIFFQAQGDTPVKLAAFAYAVEHLEIGGYELLRHVAERAGDAATIDLSHRILRDEREMADRVLSSFDEVFEVQHPAQPVRPL